MKAPWTVLLHQGMPHDEPARYLTATLFVVKAETITPDAALRVARRLCSENPAFVCLVRSGDRNRWLVEHRAVWSVRDGRLELAT